MREFASPFLIISRPGEINEDATHQAGTNRVEMRPILPIDALHVHQPKIDLMNQRGGLKSVARLLRGHVPPGQAMEFAIDNRHELLERTIVARSPGLEQAS